MSFFLFKKQPSLSFVFDIRDSSISIAATKFTKNNKPEIILCNNYRLKYKDSENSSKYLDSMITILDQAIVSIRQGLVKIGNIDPINKYYFFLGSPWSISQSKAIKMIKDKTFEINNSVLAKIIVGEETSMGKGLKSIDFSKNWNLFEEKIIQSKINGYKVDDIFGQKTTNLSIELFASFMPFELKNKLQSLMNEKLNKHIKIQSNSSMLSSYSFFRDLYLDKNDFIYVDVGNLITDIYVVRDDVIFDVISFPFGEEHIIKKSLSKTDIPRSIFLSYVNTNHHKMFDKKMSEKVEELLKPALSLWLENFKKTISAVCSDVNMPNNIFFISNSVISEKLLKSPTDFSVSYPNTNIVNIPESIINGFINNSTKYINEPYVKMDIIFVQQNFIK